jgi:hypothetical protein
LFFFERFSRGILKQIYSGTYRFIKGREIDLGSHYIYLRYRFRPSVGKELAAPFLQLAKF